MQNQCYPSNDWDR